MGCLFFINNNLAVNMGLYGWRLASLIGAALLGGYALATATGIFLGSVLPIPRSEAAVIGNLLSFAVYVGAIIWVFSLRKPGRAWLSLLLSSILLSAIGLALRGQVL